MTARDDFWERKYAETEDGTVRPVPVGASDDHASEVHAHGEELHDSEGHHIHMPDPSWWPLVTPFGMIVFGYGIVFTSAALIAGGVLVMLIGMFGWILEPVAEGDDDYEPEALTA